MWVDNESRNTHNSYYIPCFYVEVVHSQLNMVPLWDLDDVGTVQIVSIPGVAR